MKDEIELEGWSAGDRDRPIPEAGRYRVRLWDGDGFDEKRVLTDPMPTGRQILDLFDRAPADEHVLLMLSRSSGLDVIDLAETIDIRGRGAERFFAFRTDRTWNWAIDGQRFPWGARHIPEPLVRLIARIPEDHALYLAKTEMPDEEVEAGTAIDLDAPGLERLYSQGRQWKFNVQGVLLKLGMPTIVVKDALTQAGFDTAQGWQIFLKVAGQKKQPVELTTEIDLRTPGIEKLRLTPKEVNNGEALPAPSRAFALLEIDEVHLDRLGLRWETIVETNRRWLLIHNYPIPSGYTVERTKLALEIPPTYPGAQIYGFYAYPPLALTSGRSIDRTQLRGALLGVEFHGWSRRRGPDAPWNPTTDSVVTQLALVEAALAKEVGE